MKLFILFLSLAASFNVRADSFTIIRDGQEYLCEQRTPGTPGDSVACANKAYQGPFSREESQQLCAGARSVAPADCGIKAYQGPFSKVEAVQLCTRARTIGPADCGIKAYQGPFLKKRLLRFVAVTVQSPMLTARLKPTKVLTRKKKPFVCVKNNRCLSCAVLI